MRIRKDLSLVALVAAAVVLTAGPFNTLETAVTAQAGACTATTTSGDVRGSRAGGACTYLGIPYATPPVGDRRWRGPQPAVRWAPSTFDATVLRQCPQINANTGAVAGNEDCLRLNVWAPPATSSPLPVLVWLHTGGFQAATANFPSSNGARFAEAREVVVVAPNYRLGPLGFLRHGALTLEDPAYPSSSGSPLCGR